MVPSLPCNQPATKRIGWPERGEGPYRMCDMCADHSIKNRGATDLGPSHVFKYTDWFMAPTGQSRGDVDWDCDFYYLIVTGDEVETMVGNSQFDESRMREQYPIRIEHEADISRHRGHLECSSEVDKLKEDHPEVWERLNKWCEFKDRRK